jgi:hypothetical protein
MPTEKIVAGFVPSHYLPQEKFASKSVISSTQKLELRCQLLRRNQLSSYTRPEKFCAKQKPSKFDLAKRFGADFFWLSETDFQAKVFCAQKTLA